jgi:hypothetical protein
VDEVAGGEEVEPLAALGRYALLYGGTDLFFQQVEEVECILRHCWRF